MQIKTNPKKKINITWKQLFLAVAFLFMIVAGAKLDIDLGGLVSFTLQTLIIGIAYYFLPSKWKLATILVYLLLGIVGFPVFNGGSGWSYFSSWPLGFFLGFIFAAFIQVPAYPNFHNALSFFLQIHVVILLFGIIGVGIYTESVTKAFDTCLELLPGAVIKSLIGALVIWFYHVIVVTYKRE